MSMFHAILILATVLLTYADEPGPFNHIVSRIEADLNKDRVPDIIIVSQDTLHDLSPYRVQIFFRKPDGSRKLIVTADSAIIPQYPNGKKGYREGNEFYNITVKNGVVSINQGLLRGHFEHKYRFQNGNFELIGYTDGYSDGRGCIYTIDFNLSTGVRFERKEGYSEEGTLEYNIRKKVFIRPLPRLQHITPFSIEHELY